MAASLHREVPLEPPLAGPPFRYVVDVEPSPSGRVVIRACKQVEFPLLDFPKSRSDLLTKDGNRTVSVEVKWPRGSAPSPFELRYMPPSQEFRLRGLLASQQPPSRFHSAQELGSLLIHAIVSYLVLEAADILRARSNSSMRLQTEFVKSFREVASQRALGPGSSDKAGRKARST
jgi:hypothetical protein